MTIAAAAAEEEEYEAPVDFGDATHSRGMATSATTSIASSSRILRTPASAPAFSGDDKKTAAAANSSIKSDQIASKNQRSKPSKLNNATRLPEDGNNSFHSSPQLMQNNNSSSTPQRIQSSSRRDLEQKLRYRSNRDRNNATFQHRSGNIQRNDISNTKNDDVRENNNNNNVSSAPLPKALTDLLLQTAILGIDTTAKLSKPTLALTKNTLLPQIILPLLTELWETYAPDRLQTWMKVLPSSLKNLHDLLWETDAGKQFGQTSFQLGEDVVDMISSEVARQYCIDVTVALIKFMDALHTPEVRKLLDQFAISMCRLVDVMSSGKAKQIWFDVSDTIWAALEVGSDDVMVMALAEGCAKVCFALERERESLKRRKRGGVVGGDGSDEVGRSGKVKTERLIEASRRRKERDQRQMETYPPGKEVLRGEGGRADIEDALMDGLGSFTRDDDQQQREDDNVVDDADQIYMNMSSIVDNNDRPPQRVIVHTTSMEDHPQPFPDPNSVLDRDDESEITTEIEDLRRNDIVEHGNDFRPQSSASTQMTDNRHQQDGALVYEDERGNPLDNDALSKYDDVDDEQDGVSEQYDNFDEPVLQFYRRLNDVLTQTRKETNLREALEKKQNDASSKRAGHANVQNDDRSIEPINQENGADQSASHALFSISKKWWKLLFVVMICGTLTMCLLWAALGCYGFYVLFIAETHVPLTASQVQPIVIQIVSTSNQGLNNACTLETDQSDRHDVASISLDDWKELKNDVDAAIDLIKSE